MKLRGVRAEFFHADGQTDRRTGGRTYRLDESTVRPSQFCESGGAIM
jgi:hypothetical protein